MIELFDPQKLLVKRDRSLLLAAACLGLSLSLVGAYALWLQVQISNSQGRSQTLQSQLAAAQRNGPGTGYSTAPSTTTNTTTSTTDHAAKLTLVADLRRQAEHLERELALAGARSVESPTETHSDPALSPTQWLVQLGQLAQPQTSLQKVTVDRLGGADIEGTATNAQALNQWIQAWEKSEALAWVQPRSLQVKQDKAQHEFLRFQLLASPLHALQPKGPGRAVKPAAGTSNPPAVPH